MEFWIYSKFLMALSIWNLSTFRETHAKSATIRCIWNVDPWIGPTLGDGVVGYFAEHYITKFLIGFPMVIPPYIAYPRETQHTLIGFSLPRATFNQYIQACDGMSGKPPAPTTPGFQMKTGLMATTYSRDFNVMIDGTNDVPLYVWLGWKNGDDGYRAMCRYMEGPPCWLRFNNTDQYQWVTGFFSGNTYMVTDKRYRHLLQNCKNASYTNVMISTATKTYPFYNMDKDVREPTTTSSGSNKPPKTLPLKRAFRLQVVPPRDTIRNTAKPSNKRPRKPTKKPTRKSTRKPPQAQGRPSGRRPSNAIGGRRRVKRSPYCQRSP